MCSEIFPLCFLFCTLNPLHTWSLNFISEKILFIISSYISVAQNANSHTINVFFFFPPCTLLNHNFQVAMWLGEFWPMEYGQKRCVASPGLASKLSHMSLLILFLHSLSGWKQRIWQQTLKI